MPSGTKPTENKQLGAEDICAILKSCGASRVAELKFGDLYIAFDRPSPRTKAPQGAVEEKLPHPVVDPTDNPETVSAEQTELDELRLKDEQIAHMLIENPQLAEELLIKGELTRTDEHT